MHHKPQHPHSWEWSTGQTPDTSPGTHTATRTALAAENRDKHAQVKELCEEKGKSHTQLICSAPTSIS